MRRDYLVGRHHLLQLPAVEIAHVHVLDEPDHVPGAFEPPGQANDGVVVDPFLHHRVDLDGSQSGVGRPLDALEDAADAKAAAVHLLERVFIQRVQAHRDPVQARVPELLRLLRQQVAVGGEGQVFHAVDLREHGDQAAQVRAQQRLSPGDAHLPHSQAGEDPREAGDFPRS